jgi:hypothetical protein
VRLFSFRLNHRNGRRTDEDPFQTGLRISIEMDLSGFIVS